MFVLGIVMFSDALWVSGHFLHRTPCLSPTAQFHSVYFVKVPLYMSLNMFVDYSVHVWLNHFKCSDHSWHKHFHNDSWTCSWMLNNVNKHNKAHADSLGEVCSALKPRPLIKRETASKHTKGCFSDENNLLWVISQSSPIGQAVTSPIVLKKNDPFSAKSKSSKTMWPKMITRKKTRPRAVQGAH